MKRISPNPEIEAAAEAKRARRAARDIRWAKLNEEGRQKSLERLRALVAMEPLNQAARLLESSL